MNEWSLPADAAKSYAALIAQVRTAGDLDSHKPFLRGGIWKNFLVRYPEANWMHKRMLALSARMAALPEEPDSDALRTLLYGAQANDAYWHGLFGGLYLPHLRRAVYRNLVTLEASLDARQPRPPTARSDLDCDGNDELFLLNGQLQVVLKLDGSAAIAEFDDYQLRQNFGDTLRRHSEHYHRLISRAPQEAAQEGGIASAHDRLSFKEVFGADDIRPDAEPQFMLRDSIVTRGGKLLGLNSYREVAQSELHPSAVFAADVSGGRAIKELSLADRALTACYRLDGLTGGEFQTRLALAMPCCNGVAGRYIVSGQIAGGFGQAFEWPGTAEVLLEDLFLRGRITLTAEPPAHVTVRPYHTISQSEGGLERIMQAVTVVVAWSITRDQESLRLVIRTGGVQT
jgi:hypothetical protein